MPFPSRRIGKVDPAPDDLHDGMGRHHIIHVDVIPHARSIGVSNGSRKWSNVPLPLHHIKQDG